METGNSPQPVSIIEKYSLAFADQCRSRNLANGVFLSTVHSLKGLEFDHVFLLGERWQEAETAEGEEERRLFYVARSRARESLQLFMIDKISNPHAEKMSDEWGLRR